MPLSYAHSQGDGVNRNFDVPCDYLSRTHVKVKVDGVDVPFTWIDTYRVQTVTAPPMGSVVEVRRTTPRVERLVTFRDGSTLVETDLNVSTLQSFFLAQEAFDQGAASMAVTEDGQFSALNRRITLLADPVHAQDAVTKRWAETAMSSQLQQATQKAAAAAASATTASQKETGAIAASSRADASDAHATAMALKAEGHEKAASEKAISAAASDASGKASVTAAKGHEDRAKIYADQAAESAERVGEFDPQSYYKKPEADSKFATPADVSAGVNTAIAGNMPGRAYPRRSDGAAMTFSWSGQPGQPTWVWGGTGTEGDGGTYRVWNPSNFNVNYAASAGNANSVGGVTWPGINGVIEDRSYWRTRDYLLAEVIPVGGYALLRRDSGDAGVHVIIGGGDARWSNARGNDDNYPIVGWGTWRACGLVKNTSDGDARTTIFQRIG